MDTKHTLKTARVVREYRTTYKGWKLVVPVGATVTNQTACGPDDSYRFWKDWGDQVRTLTGFPNSILAHDLRHYGLNIPADHCEPYSAAA